MSGQIRIDRAELVYHRPGPARVSYAPARYIQVERSSASGMGGGDWREDAGGLSRAGVI